MLSILRLGNDTNIPILQKKSQKQTLNDIAKLYFKDLSNRATKNGLRETISKYNKHIKDNLGNYAFISITKEQGLNLQNELKKNGYANATINTTIGLIKTIFNFAIKEQIYNNNPFKQINNLKTDNKRLRFLSIDEIKKLKKAVKSDEVIYLFVCLSLSVGARLQSVLNIQNKDINYDENYINIYDFKNKSYYIGALTSEIKSILLSKELKQDDYIISYTKGAKCEPKRIQRRLKSVFDKLFNKGLDKNDTINRVVIHTLRHTFASQLALNKTSLFTIQKLLNHKDIKQTMRYAKLTKDNGLNEVLKIFDKI
ncbi:tyrosine-type recombinase/integrase [Campylobacter ureolyticus]|uniref:tyrosine-type recombinase/integrase n=1 Tax=Campylobacter ureolyticus TaxID=827 RepID=UPI0012EBBC99